MVDVHTNEIVQALDFINSCCSIDLEIGKSDGKIYQIGAYLPNTKGEYLFSRGKLTQALNELDQFCDEAAIIIGHNYLLFDQGYLQKKFPACITLQTSSRYTLDESVGLS